MQFGLDCRASRYYTSVCCCYSELSSLHDVCMPHPRYMSHNYLPLAVYGGCGICTTKSYSIHLSGGQYIFIYIMTSGYIDTVRILIYYGIM